MIRSGRRRERLEERDELRADMAERLMNERGKGSVYASAPPDSTAKRTPRRMNAPAAAPSATQTAPAADGRWWLAGALVFAWFLILRACWWEWSLNPQYEYGMLVPVLVVLLFARRWADRPEPLAPAGAGRAAALVTAGAAAIVLALVQPAVLSNADWRVVPAAAAGAGVVLTLAAIYLAGGRSWLVHFAFPVAFFLVAVPWPRPLEDGIMSWLMQRNTAFVVEALQWLGYPAEQRGNLIAIPGALLGVEEACSGIRSLQSGIMVALAVGEFFRLSAARRVGLLILGLVAALTGNALRSLTLSLAACRSGSEAVDAIHDGTGLAVLVVASVLVLLAGKLLARPAPAAPPSPALPPALAAPLRAPGWRLAAASLVALWATAWLGGEAWFRRHEQEAGPTAPMWRLAAPGPDEDARPVPLAERTLDILLYPEVAESEQWRDDSGWQWQSFFFRWAPGPTSVQSAFVVHDPRICLGAAGFELDKSLPPWTARVNGFEIPFQRYLFRDRGRPVHVFHAVVEDDGSPVTTGSSFERGTRLTNILEGRRNRGLRVLELAVRGPLDGAAAERSAEAWLQRRVTADAPRP
jgi:exosortase